MDRSLKADELGGRLPAAPRFVSVDVLDRDGGPPIQRAEVEHPDGTRSVVRSAGAGVAGTPALDAPDEDDAARERRMRAEYEFASKALRTCDDPIWHARRDAAAAELAALAHSRPPAAPTTARPRPRGAGRPAARRTRSTAGGDSGDGDPPDEPGPGEPAPLDPLAQLLSELRLGAQLAMFGREVA